MPLPLDPPVFDRGLKDIPIQIFLLRRMSWLRAIAEAMEVALLIPQIELGDVQPLWK